LRPPWSGISRSETGGTFVIRRVARETGGSRLSRRDVLRVGSLGLRSRRVRALLSALGISIGIAAIVGVLRISQSSKSGLLNRATRRFEFAASRIGAERIERVQPSLDAPGSRRASASVRWRYPTVS
jgi:hypothetical protein